jgi:hypothetical protein
VLCCAVRQFPQFAYRGLALGDAGTQGVAQPLGVVVEQGRLLLSGKGQQPLLGAVVQGPLDPAAFLELGGGDPGPGGPYLFELERDGRTPPARRL